jgi:ABC-type sulfate transport system permease component
MFDRLKRTLVESFVGAIALGYLFAQAALNFVNVFSAPVAGWARRREFPGATAAAGLSLHAALPQLVSFVVLLLIWYVLLRWLYFTPPKRATSEPAPNPAQVA